VLNKKATKQQRNKKSDKTAKQRRAPKFQSIPELVAVEAQYKDRQTDRHMDDNQGTSKTSSKDIRNIIHLVFTILTIHEL